MQEALEMVGAVFREKKKAQNVRTNILRILAKNYAQKTNESYK